MDSLQPNTITDSETSPDSNHKKRRKITHPQNPLNLMPWRSNADQQIYSLRLANALCRIPRPAAQIRDTADRVLAATAKGRTRWSRAILTRRKKLRIKKVKRAASGLRRAAIGRRKRLPAVQKKARVLGRLVPGCRKVSFPNLLEEATDYISALEMQVRAMAALAELLSGGAPAAHVLT
uniref:BHLH domain-containing protein n=1 Tax=Lotus japonicus TaxID=34305 RepID=I3T7S8_LOTJA|nr:unknown [Lotus japonicus]